MDGRRFTIFNFCWLRRLLNIPQISGTSTRWYLPPDHLWQTHQQLLLRHPQSPAWHQLNLRKLPQIQRTQPHGNQLRLITLQHPAHPTQFLRASDAKQLKKQSWGQPLQKIKNNKIERINHAILLQRTSRSQTQNPQIRPTKTHQKKKNIKLRLRRIIHQPRTFQLRRIHSRQQNSQQKQLLRITKKSHTQQCQTLSDYVI